MATNGAGMDSIKAIPAARLMGAALAWRPLSREL
jgi:hypothetical protein